MKLHPLIRSGFSLIELTLALGVAAVSLISIFGLLATGAQVHHAAVEQTAAGDILTAIAADLRATPKTSPLGGPTSSPQFAIHIPASPVSAPGPAPTTLYLSAQGQSSPPPGAEHYRLTVTFLPNGGAPRTATFVNLRMTWPAAADPTNVNTGAGVMFVALDRN